LKAHFRHHHSLMTYKSLNRYQEMYLDLILILIQFFEYRYLNLILDLDLNPDLYLVLNQFHMLYLKFALLNFLLPEVFGDSEVFEEYFKLEDMADPRFRIEDILSFPLFHGLENQVPALEALMAVMKFESFQVRDLIIKEQSSGQSPEQSNDDRIFLLLTGEIEVNKVKPTGKVVVLGRANSQLHPFFGESALLGRPGRISNVVAYSACTCLSLRSKDFETFALRFPNVGVQIYRNMAIMMFDRLSKADTDLMILSTN